MVVEELHHLLAGPVLGVHAGIDNQANGAPHVAFKAAVIRVWIPIKSNVFSKALGIQSPALGIGSVSTEFSELWNAREFARNRYLEMMTGDALVVSHVFDCVKIAVGWIVGINE